MSELKTKRQQRENNALAISGMLFELHEFDGLPISFNKKLWNAAVDRITVYADEKLMFRFKDGKDIEVEF